MGDSNATPECVQRTEETTSAQTQQILDIVTQTASTLDCLWGQRRVYRATLAAIADAARVLDATAEGKRKKTYATALQRIRDMANEALQRCDDCPEPGAQRCRSSAP